MRALSEAFQARLSGGVTTLCWAWRIARSDGLTLGFTDHDAPLMLDGLSCAPHAALSGGAIEKSSDAAVDSAQAAGALRDDAIAEADLAAGLWDGARVDVYRVDWTDPSLRAHMFAGFIGEVRRGAQAFEAELRGLQAPLNVARGRVFSRTCDADFGDARCGVDASLPIYRGEGVVSAVLAANAVRVSGLGGFADGWFARGRLTWSGGGADIATHRAVGAEAILETYDATPLHVGDTVAAVAGCDKRFATCREKFFNAENFRGFPDMPGNDAVQAGPTPGAPMDGGSRRR